MNFRKPRPEEPEINLIPFIDVLLVILIFLMLSTTYSKFTELQITLPVADAEKSRDRPNEIIVAVAADGRYAVNRKPVEGRSVEVLTAELAAAAANAHEPIVIVSADATAAHQSVINVMDAARDARAGAAHAVSQRLQRAWLSRGPWAIALLPLAVLFAALVAARRALYRLGWLRSERLPVPVIVVGNLMVGGAGKTPTVMAVASMLRRHGFQPGVISRGYGRQSDSLLAVERDTRVERCGDEPLLLRIRLNLPVVVGTDRVAAARELLRRHPHIDAIVSDDGLQHLHLARDGQATAGCCRRVRCASRCRSICPPTASCSTTQIKRRRGCPVASHDAVSQAQWHSPIGGPVSQQRSRR
ncbi:MAG: tetraacyldisaccharide 4'-kinase [Betaproteobacteria bacterium]|nr:MAG: tetraacyldisaccharide 4'-kinase [Betaproteobacteria bacterium]